MKILFCGDVVGRSGRRAILEYIPKLRKKLRLDFVIVNGENSASGFGLTKKICEDFFTKGVDVITCGDHVFDQKEMIFRIDEDKRILRPANLPKHLPGLGHYIYTSGSGKRLLVIHLHAQLFMKLTVDSPFEKAKEILSKYKLGSNIDGVIVDFHSEASSEKMAMGHFLDGKVSLVIGTHTHIPTADTQILSNGTAYQSDAGMCGDYDSVIGFNKEISVAGFVNKIRRDKLTPALNNPTLCGIYIETDDKTGLAKQAHPIKMGGRLKESMPII